jgi:hypothetical protein
MDSRDSLRNVESVSRRRFAVSGITVAAVSLMPATAVGEDERTSAPRTVLGVRPEGLSAADWDEVRAKYSNLLRVYEKRLSVEEKERLVRILTTNQHMLASIRSFEVQNGDPSACTLRI